MCIEDSKVGGSFYYSASNGLEFDEDEYLPREFKFFKRNVIRHLETSKSHMEAVTDIRAKEKAKNTLISKNRQPELILVDFAWKNTSREGLALTMKLMS